MRLILLSFLLLAFTASCSFTKDLEQHRLRLAAATAPDVSLADKRDALGLSTVAMMHEAVDRLNPKKGAKYVQAYAKTNGPFIDTLVAQLKRGQANMSQTQRIAFGLSAITRPYAKDAIDLIPRFVRKYQQIQAVARITGGLKDVILGKAAEQLGGLFGETSLPLLLLQPHQFPLDVHRQREAKTYPSLPIRPILKPDPAA